MNLGHLCYPVNSGDDYNHLQPTSPWSRAPPAWYSSTWRAAWPTALSRDIGGLGIGAGKSRGFGLGNPVWLVVGPPLWKIWKSIGMTIPNIWEHKKCSKPPTSAAFLWFFHPSLRLLLLLELLLEWKHPSLAGLAIKWSCQVGNWNTVPG